MSSQPYLVLSKYQSEDVGWAYLLDLEVMHMLKLGVALVFSEVHVNAGAAEIDLKAPIMRQLPEVPED